MWRRQLTACDQERFTSDIVPKVRVTGGWRVVARVEANVGYDITDTVEVSAGGGFAFDSATASFVAPNYIAGTPARIDMKSATSPYAGVRVSARF